MAGSAGSRAGGGSVVRAPWACDPAQLAAAGVSVHCAALTRGHGLAGDSAGQGRDREGGWRKQEVPEVRGVSALQAEVGKALPCSGNTELAVWSCTSLSP